MEEEKLAVKNSGSNKKEENPKGATIFGEEEENCSQKIEEKEEEQLKNSPHLMNGTDEKKEKVAPLLVPDPGTDLELVAKMQTVFDLMNDSLNFSQVGRNLTVVAASKTSLAVEFELREEHVNNKGSMHGGFTAALTDIVTARTVGITVRNVPMVSVEIAVSYMNQAQLGDIVRVEANCLKIGRSMAFSEATFRRKRDGVVLAKGKHNIAFLNHLKGQGADDSDASGGPSPVNQF